MYEQIQHVHVAKHTELVHMGMIWWRNNKTVVVMM